MEGYKGDCCGFRGSDGSDAVRQASDGQISKEFRIRRSIPLITLQFRCQVAESDGLLSQMGQMFRWSDELEKSPTRAGKA